jgi:uncharacterized protein (DUF1800 family)
MTASAASIAAHRFGLGEPDLRPLRADPRGWLLAQLDAPAAMDLAGLSDSATMLALGRRVLRANLQGSPPAMSPPAPSAEAGSMAVSREAASAAADPDRPALRRAVAQGLQRRWQHAVTTPAPVHERWVRFWSNHFCVAQTKGTMLGMVWPFEQEAVRPHADGRFVDLLRAATTHPSMLLYLDNAASFGPDSVVGRRARRGLNENHARELLELHTVGVAAGYTQADVVELARLLTGWTVARDPQAAPSRLALVPVADGWPSGFVAAMHQPGSKQVLGATYAEGPQALEAVLAALARHPATARHLATKLVRHFVADEPPPDLVAAVAARWRETDGDLAAVRRALFTHPAAWTADRPPKFKTPEDWWLSMHRVLGLPVDEVERGVAWMTRLGQPPSRAPSPQGWPDRRADWLSPDALWQRVEAAAAVAARLGGRVDARSRADAAFGPDLGDETRRQIERAASGEQALALWLASPSFLTR